MTYTMDIGRTADGRKVHLAISTLDQTCCDSRKTVVDVLAVTDPGTELTDLIDTLVRLHLSPSHLCAKCFGNRTKLMLRNAYLTAAR